ncbi:MAG: hypothetical protein KIT31_10955, partial [Deltaproteobacteria bacterium]|nr:hypothetical protein [Deltaproteobacteria bacterium]
MTQATAQATRPEDTAYLARLVSLRDVANASAVIDPHAAGEDDGVRDTLRALVERTLAILAELAGPDDGAEPSDAEPPRVADVAFAGGFELRRMVRDLAAAATPDER